MTEKQKNVIYAAGRVVNCSEGGCNKCLAALRKAVKLLGRPTKGKSARG